MGNLGLSPFQSKENMKKNSIGESTKNKLLLIETLQQEILSTFKETSELKHRKIVRTTSSS